MHIPVIVRQRAIRAGVIFIIGQRAAVKESNGSSIPRPGGPAPGDRILDIVGRVAIRPKAAVKHLPAPIVIPPMIQIRRRPEGFAHHLPARVIHQSRRVIAAHAITEIATEVRQLARRVVAVIHHALRGISLALHIARQIIGARRSVDVPPIRIGGILMILVLSLHATQGIVSGHHIQGFHRIGAASHPIIGGEVVAQLPFAIRCRIKHMHDLMRVRLIGVKAQRAIQRIVRIPEGAIQGIHFVDQVAVVVVGVVDRAAFGIRGRGQSFERIINKGARLCALCHGQQIIQHIIGVIGRLGRCGRRA